MLIKIKCEKCGQEKDLEVKVPKFCSKECRMANLREKRGKKPEVPPMPPIPPDPIPPEAPEVPKAPEPTPVV